MGDFCDYSLPNPIFADTNVVFIRSRRVPEAYTSHINNADISYLASERIPGCGGNLNTFGGQFASPYYGINFRQNMECRWDITVPQGERVALQFDNFDFGTNNTCETNYVQLIEVGLESYDDRVVRTYCGDQKPSIYVGERNVLVVIANMTVNFAGIGFTAAYTGVPEGKFLIFITDYKY